MLFWKEIPNLWQAVGLLLTFVAIPLLSQREKEPTYKFTPDRPEMSAKVWDSLLLLYDSAYHRYLAAHHESLQRDVSY